MLFFNARGKSSLRIAFLLFGNKRFFFSLQGASIIRMLQFYLGRKVFLQGLTVSMASSVLRVSQGLWTKRGLTVAVHVLY